MHAITRLCGIAAMLMLGAVPHRSMAQGNAAQDNAGMRAQFRARRRHGAVSARLISSFLKAQPTAIRTADANVSTPPQATKNQRTNDMRAGSLSVAAARTTSVAS